MQARFLAAFVHLFTGLGAVCALLAILALGDERWEAAFAWLGLALFIDGIDGTLARRFEVKRHLPRFDGAVLDLIIDYLTYVLVRVLALLAAGYLSGWLGFGLAALVLLSAVYHFSDTESKAADFTFVGFPTLWNLVAFLIFCFDAGTAATAIVIVVLVLLTFLPLPWLHPFRVRRLRPLTIAIVAASGATAISVLISGFPAASWQKSVLLAAAVYGVVLPLMLRRF